MRCRLGAGESAVGKRQGLVDSTEHPQHEGVVNLRCGAGILAKPVGEIAMARRVVELDSLLKMVMSARKIAEINTGLTGNAVRIQAFGAVRLSRRFAQEKLRHFARRCGFAPRKVPDPKTVIGGETLRGVFRPVSQFAGARKGRSRFRRRISLGPQQRIAEAGLELKALLTRRGDALHLIAFRERREKGLRLGKFGELLCRREALDRRRQHGVRIGVAVGRAIKPRK